MPDRDTADDEVMLSPDSQVFLKLMDIAVMIEAGRGRVTGYRKLPLKTMSDKAPKRRAIPKKKA